MDNRIQILDCTLRDGGFCLEDAIKNKVFVKEFDEDETKRIINLLKNAKIDIIELGAIEISNTDKRSLAIYQDIEEISKMIPQAHEEHQLYAAFYRGPDTPLEDIPEWNPSLCEVVRVIIRYSELQKSLEFCKALAQKGYKVFVQPMLTMRYTPEEIQQLIMASNEMGAYALYFVDSYGYMTENDVVELFRCFDKGLLPSIRIGFHAHNNMNLAFANVLAFIRISGERKIIIDSCALGMGQGAGNLQTEIIADYLNSSHGTQYNFNSILEICEMIEEHNKDKLWGYTVERFISAARKTAYKYAVALRDKYNLSFAEIDNILQNMPEGLRHRYTAENVERLLLSKKK